MDCTKKYKLLVVGEFLRDCRKDMGLSQQKLAELAHVCRDTISDYENGIHCPTAEVIERVGRVLGVNNIIIDYETDPKKRREFIEYMNKYYGKWEKR